MKIKMRGSRVQSLQLLEAKDSKVRNSRKVRMRGQESIVTVCMNVGRGGTITITHNRADGWLHPVPRHTSRLR
jgi:hypothetical protein